MRSLVSALTVVLQLALAIPAASAQEHARSAPGPVGQAATPQRDRRPPATQRLEAVVMVLHATNSNKGIDPRIGKMPELKNPPFSSYNSYQLLARHRLRLAEGKPKSVRLPNKRVLQTKLLQRLPKDTVRISASIDQPGGKTFLPLLEVKAKLGQTFIVAGQSYQRGILVLVIRVVSR